MIRGSKYSDESKMYREKMKKESGLIPGETSKEHS